MSGGLAWFCSTFITAGPGPLLILLVVVAIIKHRLNRNIWSIAIGGAPYGVSGVRVLPGSILSQ